MSRFKLTPAWFAVLLALAFALLAEAALAASSAAPLEKRLERALKAKGVSPAKTGVFVFDLGTGEVIFRRNESRSFIPASTEKLPVALAALVKLGPNLRIKTDVMGAGSRSGASWKGDVYIKGYGDPTLRRSDLTKLARQIRARGIRKITGRVRGDESYFDTVRTGPGWKSSYYLVESPPISALVFDRAWVNGRMRTDPALATARAFRAELKKAGVAISTKARKGKAPRRAAPLARVVSEKLAVIVREMNRESDNFRAEMLLKVIGAQAGTAGSTAAGAKVVKTVLRQYGVPLSGVRIADGSGLSKHDRLTPRALAILLRAVWRDADLRWTFVNSLAVAGVNGTLEKRLVKAPARGRVKAKTGTTSLSSTLAGYVGSRYAFAILMNGDPIPWWTARKGQDRFVRLLAAQ